MTEFATNLGDDTHANFTRDAVSRTMEPPNATPEQAAAAANAQTPDAFAERLIGSICEFFQVLSIYLGDRLDLYRTLAAADAALTPAELAAAAAVDERYAREWLEHQTVAGILATVDETAPDDARRYYLPPAQAEVLANTDSLNYLAPLARAAVSAGHPLDMLLTAFRTGAGIPYEAYGRDAREGIAETNRAMYLQQLGQEWLPGAPELHARLQQAPQPRIADIGCGSGWSSIGLAQTYPHARIDGFDVDAASIEVARRNAAAAGVAERVTFHCERASAAHTDTPYDFVIAVECLHDMGDPIQALQAMRTLAGRTGEVWIVDHRAGQRFTAAGEDFELLSYGFSVLHCLPVALADCNGNGCCATGTVMRPATLERYARAAGFARIRVLPIEHLFFRFYRLEQD